MPWFRTTALMSGARCCSAWLAASEAISLSRQRKSAFSRSSGEPIIQAMLAHLRAERVLIPGAAVLERIGLAARVRTRKRAFQALADGLNEAAREALEKLLMSDPALRRSRFACLRDCTE